MQLKENFIKLLKEIIGNRYSKLTKNNGRVVYQGPNKELYAFDTQHGRFEYLDKKGMHLGEFDIDRNLTKA